MPKTIETNSQISPIGNTLNQADGLSPVIFNTAVGQMVRKTQKGRRRITTRWGK